MSISELLPSIHALPREDKFRLVQELIADLAQGENLAQEEYAIWSPTDSFAAASTLMELLEEEKKKAA